jgi:uncharacterized protein YsxB (DUF464 family)
MIVATFNEVEKKLSVRVEGHAGYAEHGKDIVCASASILAYTLASFVMNVDGSVVELASADTTIECETDDESIINAFDFAKRGYELLALNYPQYVKLIQL